MRACWSNLARTRSREGQPGSEGKTMARVEIDQFFCKGCGLCADVCPQRILELDQDTITDKGYHPAHCIDQAACIGCATCAVVCPDVAITVWK